jgi:hypothetical protein
VLALADWIGLGVDLMGSGTEARDAAGEEGAREAFWSTGQIAQGAEAPVALAQYGPGAPAGEVGPQELAVSYD